MTDDLNNLDFDDELEGGEGGEGNVSNQEPDFDPDNYVKPYIGVNGEPEPNIKQRNDEPGDEDKDDDLVTALLKSKGIKDITAIKMEAEDGSIEEKDFNSLSREEQLSILMSSESPADTSPQLYDDEIDFLNEVRDNNISVNDYINWIRQQAVEDYINSISSENSDIDSLSDEDLFLLDLKDTSPDLTDEECIAALEHEKENQVLWEKRMQGLRNSYKAKETARREEEEFLRQEEEQRQAVEFQNAIQEAVGRVDSIGEFDLDDEDKEEIAEFILGVDKTGTRYFARALNDPETLTRMAWFALNGEDALETLSKYYKEQIDAYSRANYKKGFEDGQKGKQPDKPAVTTKTTVRKPESKTTPQGGYKPISTPYYIDLD